MSAGIVVLSMAAACWDVSEDRVGTSNAAVGGAGTGILSPAGTVDGKDRAQWSAQFWEWALEYPLDDGHPFFGDAALAKRQTGNVWFWSAPDGPATFDEVLPNNKVLFLTIRDAECSSLEDPPFHGNTEAEQRTCADFWADHIRNVFLVLDGVPLSDAAAYRISSPQFTFRAPTPWVFGPTGGKATSVADGYYVLMQLSPGVHTIHYGGEFYFAPGELGPDELLLPKDITLDLRVE